MEISFSVLGPASAADHLRSFKHTVGEIHGVRTILLPADNPKDKDVFFRIETFHDDQEFCYITKDCEEFWWITADPDSGIECVTEYIQNAGMFLWDTEVAAIKKAVEEI